MNAVTTPKFPPPPRSAQKRSGFSLAFAWTNRPSARTTSAETRLSLVRPHFLVKCPMPPPRVKPPTPVVEIIPLGAARPKGCVAWSTSPQMQPAPAVTVPFGRIDSCVFDSRQIDYQASSQTPRPGRYVRRSNRHSIPCSCPKFTDEITSPTSAQRTIRRGRRSIMPL